MGSSLRKQYRQFRHPLTDDDDDDDPLTNPLAEQSVNIHSTYTSQYTQDFSVPQIKDPLITTPEEPQQVQIPEDNPSSYVYTPLRPQKKIALILGNKSYANLDNLCLSEKDACIMDSTLQKLGFITNVFLDLKNSEMKRVLADFGDNQVQQGDIVFFYYSGHAGNPKKAANNYLFGVDAAYKDRDKIDGLDFQRNVFNHLYKDCLIIVVLETCRRIKQPMIIQSQNVSTKENPGNFSLAPFQCPEGRELDIVCCCQFGKMVTEDRDQDTSLMTWALSKNMSEGGKNWSEILVQMIGDVRQQSCGGQQPLVMLNIAQVLRLDNSTLHTTDDDEEGLPKQPHKFQTISLLLSPSSEDQQILEMDIEQLIQNIKSNGTAKNVEINLQNQSNQFFIDVDLRTFAGVLKLRNIKFTASSKNDGCLYIRTLVRKQQTVRFEKCTFEGIGLSVVGEFEKDDKYGRYGSAELKSVHVRNAPCYGLYFNLLDSVHIDGKSQVETCEASGCVFYEVNNVEISGAKILDCKNDFGVRSWGVHNFKASNVEVEKCQRGLYFKDCRGTLKKTFVRDAKVGIEDVNSQIERINVIL